MRKPAFCGKHATDQCLCFRYRDSTIPLLSKSKISSLVVSSVSVQPGLYQTWSETLTTGILVKRLYYLGLLSHDGIFSLTLDMFFFNLF